MAGSARDDSGWQGATFNYATIFGGTQRGFYPICGNPFPFFRQPEFPFYRGITLSDCLAPSEHHPARSTPPQYEEIDIGDDQPIRGLKLGLWEMKRRLVEFGVKEVDYPDKTRFFFQPPGGQVFRLAQRAGVSDMAAHC